MIRFWLQPVASNSQESSRDISHDPDHKIPPALLCPPPKSTEIVILKPLRFTIRWFFLEKNYLAVKSPIMANWLQPEMIWEYQFIFHYNCDDKTEFIFQPAWKLVSWSFGTFRQARLSIFHYFFCLLIIIKASNMLGAKRENFRWL